MLKILATLFTPLALFWSGAQAQQTEISIRGLRSSNGKVILNIFKDSESYEKQTPFKVITFDKTGLKDSSLIKDLLIEQGVYAITSIDDENGNGKMDKSFIGMPKEGFGFSNFFMEKLKKPTYDQIKVDLRKMNKVAIKTKYM